MGCLQRKFLESTNLKWKTDKILIARIPLSLPIATVEGSTSLSSLSCGQRRLGIPKIWQMIDFNEGINWLRIDSGLILDSSIFMMGEIVATSARCVTRAGARRHGTPLGEVRRRRGSISGINGLCSVTLINVPS